MSGLTKITPTKITMMYQIWKLTNDLWLQHYMIGSTKTIVMHQSANDKICYGRDKDVQNKQEIYYCFIQR